MFKKEGLHNFELRWKAQKIKWINDTQSRIEYEKIKEKDKDLKQFIIEEKAKGAKIRLKYIIEGTDFGFWLNLNFFRSKKAIDGERLENMLTMGFNIFGSLTKSVI
ncbi:MAG: hypothetical protein AAF587_27455 [Bacteroidota bacterium]